MLIEGLERCRESGGGGGGGSGEGGGPDTNSTHDALDVGPQLALDLSRRWVANNHLTWRKTGFMFEKYDATRTGFGGGGGAYSTRFYTVLHSFTQFYLHSAKFELAASAGLERGARGRGSA